MDWYHVELYSRPTKATKAPVVCITDLEVHAPHVCSAEQTARQWFRRYRQTSDTIFAGCKVRGRITESCAFNHLARRSHE